FAPPNVRGWVGGRTWLNSATLLQRTNWCNDVIWGNPDVGVSAYDPRAWADRHVVAAGEATPAFIDLLLQDGAAPAARELILQTGRAGTVDNLRRALQLAVHVPAFQLG